MNNDHTMDFNYDAQTCYTLGSRLQNQTYVFTCKVKASSAVNDIEIFLQQSNGNTQQYGIHMRNVTTGWTDVTIEFTPRSNNTFDMITFNLGKFVGDIFMDNVSLKLKNGANRPELMSNNDFESGNPTGWSIKKNGDAIVSVSCTPDGYEGQ